MNKIKTICQKKLYIKKILIYNKIFKKKKKRVGQEQSGTLGRWDTNFTDIYKIDDPIEKK